MLRHIITVFAIMASCLATLKAANDPDPLPDSLLTEDRVYELTFSDPELGGRIISEMRRRQVEPKHELDILEGDLLVNNHYFDEAAELYLAALASDSVSTDPDTHMAVLHRLITCYDGIHDDRNTTKYVKLLLDEARRHGSKHMESIAMFNMGKLTYYQEDKKLGYELISEAIRLMERSDYAYKYDNLRYEYNTLLIMQQRDERYEDALATLSALERVATASTDAEPEIDNLAQKELKTLYAHQAIILRKLGRKDEAEAAYRKWLAAAPGYTEDDYIIAPYLVGSGRMAEAVKIYRAHEEQLRSRGDTISYHARQMLRSMGLIYYRMGQYKHSAEYFLRMANVTDSLKTREQASSAQELATAYEAHKKEAELAERASSIKVRNAWLVGATAALVLLLVLMWRQVRYGRLIRKKNLALVENIQELLHYKIEFDAMKQQAAKAGDGDAVADAAGGQVEVGGGLSDYETENRRIFEMLDRQVNDHRLFLNPDLTRDDLVRVAHTDKNRLAKIMQQHEYANTSDYVNRKRLDYAAAELEAHPEWTINAIAESCGLPNVPTFNRLFRKRFGMTPSEFRKALDSKP